MVICFNSSWLKWLYLVLLMSRMSPKHVSRRLVSKYSEKQQLHRSINLMLSVGPHWRGREEGRLSSSSAPRIALVDVKVNLFTWMVDGTRSQNLHKHLLPTGSDNVLECGTKYINIALHYDHSNMSKILLWRWLLRWQRICWCALLLQWSGGSGSDECIEIFADERGREGHARNKNIG